MIRVIRDKTTKKVRAFWSPPTNPGELEPQATPREHEEIKDLPSMNEETVWKVARLRAGGPPGEIYIHDSRIEADAPIVPPEIDGTPLGELERIRRETNKAPDAPITWADIAAATQRRVAQMPH